MAKKPTPTERQILELLTELLREVHRGDDRMPHVFASDSRITRGPDFVVEIENERRKMLIEYKSQASRAGIHAANEQLKHWAIDEPDSTLVYAAPFVSDELDEVLASAGLSYVDLSGNARLSLESGFILVRGRSNKFTNRGRPASPFTAASSRLSRIMLRDPAKWWRRSELTGESGLASGQVSKVVARLLDDQLLVERPDRHVRPTDGRQLLDAWADEYTRASRGRTSQKVHISGNGMGLAHRIESELHSGDTSLRWAFTGLPAAFARDSHTSFRLVSLYVDDVEAAVAQLGARDEPRGANVELLLPDDAGVWIDTEHWDGLTIVSPVQIYLDLLTLPERADEAARHFRSTQLELLADE